MRRLALCLAAVILAVVGCGVRSQTEPVAIDSARPASPSNVETQSRGYFVTVYFVRSGQLFPITRPAPDPTTATALALLTAGPDQAEAAMGLETAITPQALTVSPSAGDAVIVAATQQFTSISGDNQLLAAAQLVWTVTGSAPSHRVVITVDGDPIDVPTDQGLSRGPVQRSDYLSVAPLRGSSSAQSPTTGHS